MMSDIALQRRPDPWRLAIAPALCAGLALAVGTTALARLRQIAPLAPPATAPAPLPRWLDIPRPVQIYSLESPALRRAPLAYSARRLARGDTREDRLAFGAIVSEKAMLRLSILRGATAAPTLDEALGNLIAADGAKGTLAGAPALLATRFGAFEVAAATLDGTAGSACDAFRLMVHDPALTITGISCSAVARPSPRAALACLIDRLDVASAGEDRALARLFAAAELRRDPTCGGMRLGPDGLHAPWLDDKPATPPGKTRKHVGLIRPAQAT